jgi:hypothetical protein
MKHFTIVIALLAGAIFGFVQRPAPVSALPEQAATQPAKPPTPKAPTTAVSTRLRIDQVRSSHILDGTIGDMDLGLTVHVCNVAAAGTTVTSAVDAASVNGQILGVFPAGNQDQLIDNVVLNANGSVTVTLAAAAVAINNIRVVVSHGTPRQ